MNKKTQKSIIDLFRNQVKTIFGNNLIFAFIGGGFAKSKLKENGDIDMFICIKQRNRTKERDFIKWYLKIHKQYRLRADKKFFAEMVTIKDLNSALNYITISEPVFLVYDRKMYDALVWSGMVSSKNIGFVGQKPLYLEVKNRAIKIIKLWTSKLALKLKNFPPDEFLKYFVKYEEKI